MAILALETSCDETAVAVVTAPRTIHADVLHSQVELHRPYGGVVPELAARSHVERLMPLLDQAIAQAGGWGQIDAVAATRGPGLLGALIVGLGAAQGLALARRLPFVAVNHLHGHLLSADLAAPMRFPAVVFLASGGHTALYRMADEHRAQLVRRTVDDAVGEAFDKVAKLLGLPYPGGPSVERTARDGDATAIDLPRPAPRDPQALSLSGLKTAVRRALAAERAPSAAFRADLCAAFQSAVADVMAQALGAALADGGPWAGVYLVGGVARNAVVRARLESIAAAAGHALVAPPPALCTDNAAMIARAAWSRLQRGETDAYDVQPLSRWEVGTWD